MLPKTSKLTKSKDDKELLKWMNKNLTYHGVVKDYLYTAEEVVDNKLAHCWESTELERIELKSLGYSCKVLMLMTENVTVTHTALIYTKEQKLYWFEWAWGKHKGIHGPFDTKDELFKHIITLFKKDNGNKIHCFYGDNYIGKKESAKEYFKRAEKNKEINIKKL